MSKQLNSNEGQIRHIPLQDQSNFRDLGGYKTGHGRTVKWGEVYRSGRFPNLSDDDVLELENLGIKTVVNLLTALDVPWDSIREDYLLSNKYRRDEVQKRLAQLRLMAAEKRGITPEQVDMTNMEAFPSKAAHTSMPAKVK